MSYDAHKNLAYSNVATAPSPATSGTSLVVTAGQGALFPTPPFNATIWPTGAKPTTTNAEIVRVTNISTDTLTITRTQESTSARTVVIGDQIANTETVKVFTDIETAFPNGAWTAWTPSFTSSGGTPTTTTINIARYAQYGKLVVIRLDITITNKGTATGNIIFTTPVTALDSSAGGGGVEYENTGVSVNCNLLDTTHGYIALATGATGWVNSNQYKATLTYESA